MPASASPSVPPRRAADGRAYELGLLRRVHDEADHDARQEMIERAMDLVHQLARRFADRGIPHEELVQVGSVGLINAVDRFDPGRGHAFSTFAVPYVTGEIRRHFRDHGWAIRVTRRVQENGARVAKAADALTRTLGRTPSIRDLAEHTGLSVDDVLEALEGGRHYTALSLDAPRADDEDSATWLDAVGAADPAYAAAEARLMAVDGLRTLPLRQRQIVVMRFGLDLKQQEIADALGISQMHVSRLLRDALEHSRTALERPGRGDQPAPGTAEPVS